ncbi:MAG TPA: prolyl oligopeptidase family serine peptidase [Sphingobacteriaceae bacterium]|nr:prolyl oligopeptidase family serine peptidase [Sphingobacteriaceae bacterium]
MKNRIKLAFFLALSLAFSFSVIAQEKPAITWKDIPTWQYIRTFNSSISPDGQWLTWVSGPTKGDLTLTVKKTQDTLVYNFPIGATGTTALFSKNGQHFAFRESAKDAEVEAAKKSKKPLYTKLQVVSLSDTQKVTFDRIANFAFSGENPDWIAVGLVPAEGAPRGENAPKGTDLLLYNLNDKTTFNIGNVAEYSFNKAGNLLAYTIDANGQNGNGVLVRDMKTGITTALDNDKAQYSRINWNEEGTAFALLKANKNDKYKSEVYSVIGISKINGPQTSKVIYSGIDEDDFPEGQGISSNGQVYWSDDLSTLFFGIAKLEKKEEKKKPESSDKKENGAQDSTSSNASASRPGNSADIEKPDMIIWNWQDKRLQSAQQVQQNRDKNFNLTSGYHIASKRFIPLADEEMLRMVSVGPKQIYAIGYDYTPYEFENNLSGQSFVDVYLIDLKTGEKSLLLENQYQSASRTMAFSPDGQLLAYYKDGDYFAINLASKNHIPLTTGIQSVFVNVEDDRNVEKPATPFFGWTADSRFVLIRDNYDLWKISADGKKAVSISPNWKQDKIMVSGNFRLYPDDKGIDLKKDQYFSIFSNANKQAGFAILEAGKDQLKTLVMDDHSYGGLRKAENAGTFVFTKETSTDAPEIYVAQSKDLNASKQTSNTPDQEKYAWSSGVKLIEYVSDHGDTLQAALYLPADYVPGKSYPTITYIYERLTQGLNGYANPSFPGGGFNRAVYTSNGYAVLMPDIKYQLNEPGNSAVACVVPAVKAAIATGIVDGENVAIHGHSWGGYQTSFLITQTNIFKAAAAGAPLTNMISMYSLIYWNSGSTNQSIFESSQGRLTTGYWDNWDAYKRNSPIYYIKNVETPLLLLHNDKDGAVDYTQGIEYYNGLRRLNKPVTMITYKGENHGIVKEANRKDYAVRMLEFMDHYLKGKPAPDWWEKGIDLLDMQKHLDERAF